MATKPKNKGGRPPAPDSRERNAVVSFRLGVLKDELPPRARQPVGMPRIAKRDLSRYYGCMRDALARLDADPDDIQAVADYLSNEVELIATSSVEVIRAVLTSAAVATKRPALQGLTVTESVALMDLINRTLSGADAAAMFASTVEP